MDYQGPDWLRPVVTWWYQDEVTMFHRVVMIDLGNAVLDQPEQLRNLAYWESIQFARHGDADQWQRINSTLAKFATLESPNGQRCRATRKQSVASSKST